MINIQSNIAAFQIAVSNMWDSYTKMSRLVETDDPNISVEKLTVAMALFQVTRDLLVKAGAPLQALHGEESIDKTVLADDVASVRYSRFCASVRQDDGLRAQIRESAAETAATYAQIPDLDTAAIYGEVFDALFPAAQALQVNFTNVVEQLSPCGAV